MATATDDEFTFVDAERHNRNARFVVVGPSGSGKTFTTFIIASVLAEGEPFAVIDTERGSALDYADEFGFRHLQLEPPFSPERYIKAMEAAARAGYKVLVIDSGSHAWFGVGGILEMVDIEGERLGRNGGKKDSFRAWGTVGTPWHNRFVDTVLGYPGHVILTLRSKQDYLLQTETEGKDKGKTKIVKAGLAPVQREGLEYEFTWMLSMDMENNGFVEKSRIHREGLAVGTMIPRPGVETAEKLREWLAGGVAVESSKPWPPPLEVPDMGQPRQALPPRAGRAGQSQQARTAQTKPAGKPTGKQQDQSDRQQAIETRNRIRNHPRFQAQIHNPKLQMVGYNLAACQKMLAELDAEPDPLELLRDQIRSTSAYKAEPSEYDGLLENGSVDELRELLGDLQQPAEPPAEQPAEPEPAPTA